MVWPAQLLTGFAAIIATVQAPHTPADSDRRRPRAPPPPFYSAPPVPSGPALARGNLAAYFSSDDYPASAMRRDEEGTTQVRLSIGPNGRVADCLVTSSSGSLALDSATCRIARSRARFTPARDMAGQPIMGSVTGRIIWRLPPPAPPPPAPPPVEPAAQPGN